MSYTSAMTNINTTTTSPTPTSSSGSMFVEDKLSPRHANYYDHEKWKEEVEEMKTIVKNSRKAYRPSPRIVEDKEDLYLYGRFYDMKEVREKNEDQLFLSLLQEVEYTAILQTLDLSLNRLGESEYRVYLSTLASSLGENKSLINLYLSENSLGNEGVEVIAPALLKNRTLYKLSLYSDDIGDEGVENLCTVLSMCGEKRRDGEGLCVLGLGYNPITDRGGRALLSMLEKNKSVKKIVLKGTNISDKLVGEIERVLKERREMVEEI